MPISGDRIISKWRDEMKHGKITMRDVAKEAGVSLATVSYVLNNSSKEKISPETRVHVLNVASKLNYVHTKPQDRKSKSVAIIINYGKEATYCKRLMNYDLSAQIHYQVSKIGYETVLFTNKSFEDGSIDKYSFHGAIIVDSTTALLEKLTYNKYFPIVIIDSDTDAPLINKVIPDYRYLLNLAKKMLNSNDLFLVAEEFQNQEIKNMILPYFNTNDIYANKVGGNLKEFLKNKIGRKGLVIGDVLGTQVERYIDNEDIVVLSFNENSDILIPNTKTLIISNKTKSKAAVGILDNLLKLDYSSAYESSVLLKPDNYELL